MNTFPMFLMMRGRHVVIAGGGEQAAQKCRLMLKTEAQIVILAPALDPELAGLHADQRITWLNAPITPSSFKDAALVFVATGCPATDACLHMLAKAAGVVVNVVDQPDLCDAFTPSIVDRSPVVVAIGTEGTAPVLARQIKTRVEEFLEPRLGDLAALAGRLRGQTSMHLQPRKRRDLWRWVFNGSVRKIHASGGEREAAKLIKQAISTGEFGANESGSVSFVDVAHGHKDLLTLRAVQRLQEADVIFVERSVSPEIVDLARRDAERVFFGETQNAAALPFGNTSNLIAAALAQNQRVVVIGNKSSAMINGVRSHLNEKSPSSLEVVPSINEDVQAACNMAQFAKHA